MSFLEQNEPVDEWKSTMFLYKSAMKQVQTKIDILKDEFVEIHNYNPIEHVAARIKTPESIVKKLKRAGKEVSIENMRKYLNDIVGIRIICSFTSDIYMIADMISNQADVKVITIKNYIEHVAARIKTPESIVKKLKRAGKEVSIENMRKYLNDIVGIRIICSFTSDIYMIADMISNQADVKVITIKNYIEQPKPNGYKSYHMVISIPVFVSDGPVDVKVEIQIRTIAMDFWASLEHKIYYKFDGEAPAYISRELKACADMVNRLDKKMLSLNQAVKELEQEVKERKVREYEFHTRKAQ